MSIVPMSELSPSEVSMLGNNVLPPRRKIRPEHRQIQAINRSLAVVCEEVRRLYRRRPSSTDWLRPVGR
jgi:hypothetical protein